MSISESSIYAVYRRSIKLKPADYWSMVGVIVVAVVIMLSFTAAPIVVEVD